MINEHLIKYNEFINKYDIHDKEIKNINIIIKECLKKFTKKCKNPAIWCYGQHTRMLMVDFIYELKDVRFIIDNKLTNEQSGFNVISENEIYARKIDGIIISSYKYRKEIKERIMNQYPDIMYCDVYEELENNHICLDREYYNLNHPYVRYKKINKIRNDIKKSNSLEEKAKLLKKLLGICVVIKDFKFAIYYANQIVNIQHSSYNLEMLDELNALYNLQLSSLNKLSENNVIMLCFDGLRRKDILEGTMPALKMYISDNMYMYDNCYSVSTSTFESLIPAYSENSDMSTKYYKTNSLNQNECRFVVDALEKKRKVYFYTDSDKVVDSPNIKYTNVYQTATEKIWNFMNDALEEKNGLFYIHILYESHFSYPNPYTDREIVADGTNILFDYLDNKGGRLRTDYIQQHNDSLRYLDDTIVPFLRNMEGSIILYADHGNILLNEKTSFDNIEYNMYTMHNDLISIPFAIRSRNVKPGMSHNLFSLMNINDVVLALMNKTELPFDDKPYVKIQRSQIYNPDFKYLYKRAGYKQGLLAFECFVFKSGYKLVVYSNGVIELYDSKTEKRIDDDNIIRNLKETVLNDITVNRIIE